MASPNTNSAACRERRDRGDHLYQNCPSGRSTSYLSVRVLTVHNVCCIYYAGGWVGKQHQPTSLERKEPTNLPEEYSVPKSGRPATIRMPPDYLTAICSQTEYASMNDYALSNPAQLKLSNPASTACGAKAKKAQSENSIPDGPGVLAQTCLSNSLHLLFLRAFASASSRSLTLPREILTSPARAWPMPFAVREHSTPSPSLFRFVSSLRLPTTMT